MRAIAHILAGGWDRTTSVDTVLIDFDRRHRRRIVLRTEAGRDVLIDLPQAARLRDGDGLVLDEGGVILVQARPEPLLDIHAHDAAALVRIAWHLGNRHLPVQMLGAHLRIRRDHVIADMVHALGGHAAEIEAPFDPEPGAYAGGHQHLDDDGGHSRAHSGSHAHDH